MLKQFFDLVRRVLLLDESLKRNQAGLKDLDGKVNELTRSTSQNFQQVRILLERLAHKIERLEDELRHAREREADAWARAADARERLRIEIENRLLRENRQLPPDIEQPKKDDAE